MADKIHKTKGIVLKNVKYGETSLIVSVYTEMFGLQSYLLNGVRTTSKKAGNKLGFFQPAAILEMDVYHNEFRQLNRIKEYKWSFLYKNIFTDVLKNGVTTYMVELLTKCLKQPEDNYGLFAFAEDCFLSLDECDDRTMANFPIFFALHLTNFFGFLPERISPEIWESDTLLFDMKEGTFTNKPVFHNLYIERKQAVILANLLQVRQPNELKEISANVDDRRKILDAMEIYFNLHLQDFGKMKTLPILKEIIR